MAEIKFILEAKEFKPVAPEQDQKSVVPLMVKKTGKDLLKAAAFGLGSVFFNPVFLGAITLYFTNLYKEAKIIKTEEQKEKFIREKLFYFNSQVLKRIYKKDPNTGKVQVDANGKKVRQFSDDEVRSILDFALEYMRGFEENVRRNFDSETNTLGAVVFDRQNVLRKLKEKMLAKFKSNKNITEFLTNKDGDLGTTYKVGEQYKGGPKNGEKITVYSFIHDLAMSLVDVFIKLESLKQKDDLVKMGKRFIFNK